MNTEKAHFLFRFLCTGRLAFYTLLALFCVGLLAPIAVAADDDDGLETVWEGEKNYSNAEDEDFGGTDLENSQTVVEVDYEVVNESVAYGNENMSVSMKIQGAAGGKVEMGENGVVASGEVGIEAELAAMIQGGVGNDLLGVDVAAEAKIQALLKAEGQIGAYIDDKGLTIGAEVKAEAMVSAEASLNTT